MKKTLLFCIGIFCMTFVSAVDITISPETKSLHDALREARELRRLGKVASGETIRIRMKGGVYPMDEALFVRPEDSGTESSPTIIEAVAGEQPVLSGGVRIENWEKEGKYWTAQVPEHNGFPFLFRQLWVNGKKAVRARDVADFDDMHRIVNVDKEKQILWIPAEAVSKIKSAANGELILHQMWEIAVLRIKSITIQGDSAGIRFHQPESRIQFEHPWPSPMMKAGFHSPFYLTNIPELLDEPGEWFFDRKTRKLYYLPFPEEDMKTAEVIAPVSENLVKIAGTIDRPVRHVYFKGIAFHHTTWNRPSEQGHVPLQAGMYLLDAYKLHPPGVPGNQNKGIENQAWVGRPPAAVEVEFSQNIRFENCVFEHLGACGLDFIEGAASDRTEACIFRDIAGNGIQCGKFSDLGMETHLPYSPADERAVCSDQYFAGNLITGIGNEDWGCVGIAAGFVRRIRIEHNEICEIPYTGISLGWAWTKTVNCMEKNQVHANYIHGYARHNYDVAGIYTLSAQEGAQITENRIERIYRPPYVHDPNHWFYLYTDEGSSFITVKNNWCPEEKFLQNANGPGNIWENNGPMVSEDIKNNAGRNTTPLPPEGGVRAAKLNIYAQQATWIYYPGDYEIWLGNEMQNRRTERGAFYPPFWKMDSHYILVEFSKTLDLKESEEVSIFTEGRANIKLDGKIFPANLSETKLTIPAGRHQLNIKVHNQANVPSIFVDGKTVKSDDTWLVTYGDKEWIDESGKASDTSTGTVYLNAGSWNFNDAKTPPSGFRLETTPASAVKSVKKTTGTLYDFGKETFGYPIFHGLKGKGHLNIYYGESEEEALSTETCETFDKQVLDFEKASDWTTPDSRAFRYIFVENAPLTYDSVSMLYEYLPLEYRGNFRCNDELLNQIRDISAYTLHLTTREFFIDGIKRDRWVWSGDAYQSYLMNYYLFFDSLSVKRTILTLRGKDPVTSHINTIMDYTFYWFLGIYDYYQYTGDRKFVEQIYSRMKSLMDYCLSRRNTNGMMEGLDGDWVFIDWADFKMSKTGEVSFEQLLFYKSLKTMALFAEIANQPEDKEQYSQLAGDLYTKLFTAFWSDEKGAFIHNREKNVRSEQVTPFTNMFAVIFNELDETKKQSVKQNVLLNPQALKITTPYMRFYELEALCILGEHKHVLNEIRSYWGGMLKLGATSFWEKYNPEEKGTEHFAMYGRPFGKSLCHAWGASPLYLFGKYYLGVKPTSPGYETYSIAPNLGGLQWIEGDVPTPGGKIHVYCSTKEIRVRADSGTGVLRFSSKSEPVCKEGRVIAKGNGQYEMEISESITYSVKNIR